MKTLKHITAFALGIIMLTVTAVPQTALAASHNATLNNAKVSVNGKVTTIQTYMINGYNYVRARDITNLLSMDIEPNYSSSTGAMNGVNIKAKNGAISTGLLETLTEKSIKVEIKSGNIQYNGVTSIKTEYFTYNNRNYFKLADFGNVAQEYKKGQIDFAKIVSREPLDKEVTTFTLNWNDNTKTVDIKTEITDLREIYYTEGRGNMNLVATTPPSTTNTTTPPITKEETANVSRKYPRGTAQPELTAPPKEGTTLANILIDPAKGAVKGNYTEHYKDGTIGQCAWYARCRLYETTGANMRNTNINNISGDVVQLAIDGAYTDATGIKYLGNGDLSNMPNRGIADWSSHQVFIEYVERDSSGYPVNIYITEANTNHDGVKYLPGVFYPGFDCVVKKLSVEDFLNRGGTFYGFIIAN